MRTMRIGIDCKSMSLPYYCGLKTYTHQLVKNLALIDKANTYVLFSPFPIGAPRNKRFTIVCPHKVISWIPWQALLPIMSRFYQTDIFHIPRQHGLLFPFHPRIVTTVHDLINEVSYVDRYGKLYSYLLMSYLTLLRKYTISHSQAIITVSRFVRNELLSKGIAKRVYIIHSGVSKSFMPIKNAHFKGKNTYFLVMTDYSKRKNLDRTLYAYSGLPAAIRATCALHILVPNGKGTPGLSSLCQKLGIQQRVIFHISLTEKQLSLLYSNAVAFVYPSLAEGFGLPILEAMACGCPVITSRRTATKETAGNAALFVNPYSIEEIQEAMQRLYDDPATAHAYSRKGIVRAKGFSWEKTAKNTLMVYKKLYIQ